MIMKCTMAPICAVTDKSIKDALEYPPTREIADACFKEALAVAAALGYDLGGDYLTQALGYLQKVGLHKDSMCIDIANQTPTEIDFLGAKVVEYARAKGISERKLLFKYPVRIAINPMVSTIGWLLPRIISGSAIVSIVLNLPITVKALKIITKLPARYMS